MSFSEMMESGRGPGVIGMLLAVLVLAGFGVLFMFAFDEGLQGANRSIESVIVGQARETSDLENSISRKGKDLIEAPARHERKNDLAVLNRENQVRVAQIDSLKNGIKDTNEDIASIMMEFETYKDKFRAVVRGKARGEVIGKLEASDGSIYENVTIRDVTPVGIQIMYDGGLKRIPFEQLPTTMIERFQFDPKQKEAAMAREEAQRTEHEAAVSAAKTAVSQDLEEKKRIDAETRRDSMIRSIAIKQSRLQSLDDEIKSLEEALPKESLKRISRAPQMRVQLANKQRELSDLQAAVARMQADVSQ